MQITIRMKRGLGAGRVRGFGTYRLIFARQPPSPTVIVGAIKAMEAMSTMMAMVMMIRL